MSLGHHLVDSHCHLTMDDFCSDRMQVLERAKEASVRVIVVPGIDLLSSRRAVELAESTSGLYAAVGVHPHGAEGWRSDMLHELRDLAQSKYVVAIGEIGLDYYRDYCPVDDQKAAFKDQLGLAAELKLPVIVHNRESLTDLLPILKEWQTRLPEELKDRAGVLHAYSGDLDQGKTAIESGFYLGVAGPVTFKNAEDRREVFRVLPMDRLLVETDAPYLAPQPHRGKRNEPAYTRMVAEELAALNELELEVVANITTDNADKLFGWSNGIDNGNIL